MNKVLKVITVFIISFIVSYLIVGYVSNAIFARIHWIQGVTVWDKLREYYIRTTPFNVMPTFILTLLSTSVIIWVKRLTRGYNGIFLYKELKKSYIFNCI